MLSSFLTQAVGWSLSAASLLLSFSHIRSQHCVLKFKDDFVAIGRHDLVVRSRGQRGAAGIVLGSTGRRTVF